MNWRLPHNRLVEQFRQAWCGERLYGFLHHWLMWNQIRASADRHVMNTSP